ncbi:lipase/acyltransferase domain-containing protein [Nonomuraea jiangxiensis]|uniref:Lecithin:cholesterol acyltransferase n=1 Tax=Nonomuraea jiangxiensis TaxID=633440 RepID=A0A1G8X0S3_9ACTN|nr:alpha/beta hydrolase [Nonomuraea jiangxiensis]SDJ83937.1 Lecithin:cholesterol acyltransferase [Nonomuraea jiangxiensis]
MKLRRLVASLAVSTAVLLAGALPAPAAQAQETGGRRPVVFVHGFSGSAAQFDTQARRLAGNGYRIGLIEAHEYDSLFQVNTREQVYAGLDARIDRLLARSRADKVDLLAHSLGTSLMQEYLRSSPERAAKVAHYVNLDGASSADQPGGVPTLAVWGEGSAERQVGGAENVRFPEMSHTQVVSSPETFTRFYEFFTGRRPRTTDVAEERGPVWLSGRAVLFPSNVGAEGTRVEVYRVDPRTGERGSKRPVAAFLIGQDGSWGPFRGDGDAHYEFAVVWPTSVHHLYFQPFRRSDALVRLLTSRPGEGVSGLMESSERHTNLVINRQKEWWGDQGAAGDSLRVNGLELLNPANAPRAKRAIGIFVYDAGVDGVTDLAAPIPQFFAQPFLTAMDAFLPAKRRPLTVVSTPRGGHGERDVLTVPALPSNGHRISINFDDYTG